MNDIDRRNPSRHSVISLLLLLLEVSVVGCGRRSPPLPDEGTVLFGLPRADPAVVGHWVSGENTLHLLADRSGAFNGRLCTWKEINNRKIMTNCEAPMRDNYIRAFELFESAERKVGRLEGVEGSFLKID